MSLMNYYVGQLLNCALSTQVWMFMVPISIVYLVYIRVSSVECRVYAASYINYVAMNWYEDIQESVLYNNVFGETFYLLLLR